MTAAEGVRASSGGLAVLANPRARRLRRDPDLVEAARSRVGGAGVVLAPDGLEALDAAAAELARTRPAVVALLGGDGTSGRALTALTHAWGDDPLPLVALLGGGTMNTIARSVGTRGHPLAVLDAVVRHVEGGARLSTVRRHLLEVDGHRRGFLFGNGLFARYIEAYERGRPGPGRAAWVLAHAVGSALVGGPFARGLTRPFQARLVLDGEVLDDRRWVVAAAGTVDQVGLGFAPFVEAVRQPGRLAMIGIGCHPAALALQLHHTWRGRPMRHPDVVERVGRHLRIEAEGPQPYMLDGDLGQSGPVTTVSIGPALDLLVARAPRRLGARTARSALPGARQEPAKTER